MCFANGIHVFGVGKVNAGSNNVFQLVASLCQRGGDYFEGNKGLAVSVAFVL
jgi:hypothetical protein